MIFFISLFLVFCLEGFSQEDSPENEPHEFSLLTSKELRIENQKFHYLELGLRGMNIPSANHIHTAELKKYLTSTIIPSAVASAGVLSINPTKDKLRHFCAGYVAGNFTHGTLQILIPKTQKNRALMAFLGGVGASIVVGVGKEYWDSLGNGQVETKDALATFSGGFAGSLMINLTDLSYLNKKKEFRPLELD